MPDTALVGPDRLLVDEMFAVTLARRLVYLGLDCRSIADPPNLQTASDEEIAEASLAEDRVLVTDNAFDFELIRERRVAEGLPMPNLIYASDVRFPRNDRFMAVLAEAIFRAASEHRAAQAGGVCWLE
jgi:predicted nuclease of predicted toxin-antitoxin system